MPRGWPLVLYIIRAGPNGPVKIGITSNLLDRLTSCTAHEMTQKNLAQGGKNYLTGIAGHGTTASA